MAVPAALKSGFKIFEFFNASKNLFISSLLIVPVAAASPFRA